MARIEEMRLFLAYATHKKFKVYQMDVKKTKHRQQHHHDLDFLIRWHLKLYTRKYNENVEW